MNLNPHMKVHLFIPTLNAGKLWPKVIASIKSQTYPIDKIIIIDSGSTDGSLELTLAENFELIAIDKKDFDHGGTRQLAVTRFPEATIYVFMTQDAILASSDAIEILVDSFVSSPKIGMAYGRQLPHIEAKVLESHARLFNYPPKSQVRSLEDAPKYKIKTISCSNSFAAYRKEAFEESGGFPSGTILGEDVLLAGAMLMKGWEMKYVAESAVYHSHDYSAMEEFKRYFDIGVFHADNQWIFENFGRAESEGFNYLKSEFRYVISKNFLILPKSVLSLFAKWLGYKLGMIHRQIPSPLKRSLSMTKGYWNSEE
ncbi:glycosyltransferase family 2 protein [Algoriphagus litoralis]|uniref:glycosyltransferase family 2 protein n=1 Tax=Algoriphagus litoralis TaxID=2202829 RepID=UPI001E2A789D|nr:glycosyltransferase [Algoriphagus litoralis]